MRGGDDSSEDAKKRTEVVDRLCETLGQEGLTPRFSAVVLMIDSGNLCQFKLKLVSTAGWLQDDPKWIGRGAYAIPRRDRFRSGELKSPTGRNIPRDTHACPLASAPHA